MRLKRGPRPSKADGGFCFGPRPSTAVARERAARGGHVMSIFSRRSLLGSALIIGLLPTSLLAAEQAKGIRIERGAYNPVSMVLKEKGLLEKEFAKDGISIRWVQTLGSNKALEF